MAIPIGALADTGVGQKLESSDINPMPRHGVIKFFYTSISNKFANFWMDASYNVSGHGKEIEDIIKCDRLESVT